MANKNAENRKEQILKATFQAVVEKGFDAVTLQDISDNAGVSKGVTNYYFENKDDVFYQLLEWTIDKIYQNERLAINKETTAMDKLRAYVFAAISKPSTNRRFYKVYLDFLAQAGHKPQYRKVNDKFYENCWGIGREIVTLGIQEGIFYSTDIDKAAITIRALIDGCLIQWLMGDQDELHDFYRQTCFEGIVSSLTNKQIQVASDKK
ncbi:TetR/AcrR family transcriptional regulator [Sporosarcina sp. CAU 1771]